MSGAVAGTVDIAASRLAEWRAHPAQMVEDLFGVTLDSWQAEALEAFPHSPRMALKACKGPGKTSTLAWIGWNFLLTRPHPMCGATSINGDNLKSGLWTELARWRNKAACLQRAFEMTKTEIYARDHRETWRLEARTWAKDADAEQIGSALAGLHAEYILWLLDESGGYPDAILPTAEGIFAGSPIEPHIVQAGNPLKRSGPLFRACYSARKLWTVIEITGDPDDPKRSPRISVDHAREQIALYGRENPWVLVNIFGQFPPTDINALIGEDEVKASMARYWREHEIGNAPKVIAADVAREGDDASVIFRRQGIQCFPLEKHRNIDSNEGSGRVARIWTDWGADAAFIDMTGGWGTGWFDGLVRLGKGPIGVQFSGEAHQKSRYFNKRAEMYFDAVEWIKRGGALPLPEGTLAETSELFIGLTQITYGFKGDRFILEDKVQFKERVGFSPDETDAFVMTFAEPVSPKSRGLRLPPPSAVVDVYKPFADLER